MHIVYGGTGAVLPVPFFDQEYFLPPGLLEEKL